jgi:hypothetical protein
VYLLPFYLISFVHGIMVKKKKVFGWNWHVFLPPKSEPIGHIVYVETPLSSHWFISLFRTYRGIPIVLKPTFCAKDTLNFAINTRKGATTKYTFKIEHDIQTTTLLCMIITCTEK